MRQELWSATPCSYIRGHGISWVSLWSIQSLLYLNQHELARLQPHISFITRQQPSWGQHRKKMIYKKTAPWIRERKALIRSKSSGWQTLILWTFCTWTKAPTFLNYMVWAGACFQDLPNHTTAIYFPNCSCQNFPDLCSVIHLQGHLVNAWHCRAAFCTRLLKPHSSIWRFPQYIIYLKNSQTRIKVGREKVIRYQNISFYFEVNSLFWRAANILSPQCDGISLVWGYQTESFWGS